jgi:hypothetical protein
MKPSSATELQSDAVPLPKTRPANVVMRLTPLDWEILEELRRLMPGATTSALLRHAIREYHRWLTRGAPPWVPSPPGEPQGEG